MGFRLIIVCPGYKIVWFDKARPKSIRYARFQPMPKFANKTHMNDPVSGLTKSSPAPRAVRPLVSGEATGYVAIAHILGEWIVDSHLTAILSGLPGHYRLVSHCSMSHPAVPESPPQQNHLDMLAVKNEI